MRRDYVRSLLHFSGQRREPQILKVFCLGSLRCFRAGPCLADGIILLFKQSQFYVPCILASPVYCFAVPLFHFLALFSLSSEMLLLREMESTVPRNHRADLV